MNFFLSASINYPVLATYVNGLYDPDNWVLTGQMLGMHLADHIAKINNFEEDPDPCLTDILMTDNITYPEYVPLMMDCLAAKVEGWNGLVTECPLIMYVHRVYYDHFYRGNL